MPRRKPAPRGAQSLRACGGNLTRVRNGARLKCDACGRRRGVHEPQAAGRITEIILSKNPKDIQERAEASFKKELQARDAKKAMADYEAAGIAVREKIARLKTLRLAKEAADRAAAAPKPKAAPAKTTKPTAKPKAAKKRK
jgi:hypothetical protein